MSDGPWTVRRVLGWTTQHFEKQGVDAPRLTSELLLAHVLATSRVRLYTELDRPLEPGELARYRQLIERRLGGEPTQYLTGTREFYGRPFRVDPRVLIPRPETELLVEAVLRTLPQTGEFRVLDLCTGSGCVAVTVAAERPAVRVVATDLSEDACAVARSNAQALGVADRVEVRAGELFAAVAGDPPFDVVVSNPPYVPRGEIPGLSREVRREPVQALDGGEDGLEVIRRIAAGAGAHLSPGGLLALEIGDGQGSRVCSLLQGAGYGSVTIERDLARHDRLALGTHPRVPAPAPQGDRTLGSDPR
jgi:release factor glutamine methyltransferase